MTDNWIDSEWSSLATDNGEFVLDYNDHDVIIGGEQSEEITTSPTNVSYSPTVNKAKNLTVDVPQDARLEDLTYLGENLKLLVDGEVAFDGEIRDINTRQKKGEDYSITARPPGKKLKGSDLEDTVNNEIFSDQIAKIVDGYNQLDGRHENFVNTASETFNGSTSVGGNVIAVSNGNNSGSVSYSDVGTDISSVTSIYVKAYTPTDDKIEVGIDSETRYSFNTFDSLDKNKYGEWVRIEPDIIFNENESYGLDFFLYGDSLLIDWVSIVDEKVSREITSPDIEVISENNAFYNRSGSELENNIKNSGDGIEINSNGEPQTRKISDWANDPFPNVLDSDFVGGEGGEIETDVGQTRWQFSPGADMEDWGMYSRVKIYEIFVNRNETHTLGNSIYDNSWGGSAASSTEQIAVDDSSVKITGNADKEFQWVYNSNNVSDTLELSSQAYLDGTGTIEWIIQAGFGQTSDNEDGYGLRLGGSQMELIRLDAGSSTVLDSSSYSRQQGEWFDWSISVDDSGVDATLSDSNSSYSLSSNDSTNYEFGEFIVDTGTTHYLDDMIAEIGNDNRSTTIDVEVDGERLNSIGLILPDVDYREWGWKEITNYSFTSGFPNPINSNIDVYLEASSQNEHAFIVSPMVLVHKRSLWDSENDFDLSVHDTDGHLDYPYEYATGNVFNTEVTFTGEVSNTNIFESTVESQINTQNTIVSSWGPSQVIDSNATNFSDPPDFTDITNTFSYPGVQHTVQYTLSSGGLRDTTSPRRGYNRQILNSYSVEYSTNDLEILFDRNLSNNRLALMNSLAEDSSVLFRWEGTKAKIFHSGQETTSVDLKSENIESSVSIEDVYASCEVIGLHNVRSGVVTSDDAPNFVDDHKTIRTEDIEEESDAINRARRFLSNHGSIKYKGSISTLPTFAPLGAEVSGELFSHGQDMIIRSVRYGKRGTTIDLGYEKDIATELISLEIGTQSTKQRASSRGMTIPVGNDQI